VKRRWDCFHRLFTGASQVDTSYSLVLRRLASVLRRLAPAFYRSFVGWHWLFIDVS
ncbi:hypothetical protein HAX54_041513, partial [Datura stramonium]|nr:hypothetical protein [Datura stramonium]